jgi:N-acyl-D-amino-acid deacylase
MARFATAAALMSEDNVRRQIVLPWVSLGSDEDSRGIDGVFLKSSAHPRAYGNFARVYARYVRDEKLLPVEEAARKMTSLSGVQSRYRPARHEPHGQQSPE